MRHFKCDQMQGLVRIFPLAFYYDCAIIKSMKTVSKIDPEKEYETAKKIIEQASKSQLEADDASKLDTSVDNLITAARVLMEREERRRGKPKPPKKNKKKDTKNKKKRDDYTKLPSKKFPDLEIKEDIFYPKVIPTCSCCNKEMRESKLFDTTEKLEFEPAKYWIQRTKRPKYNCGHCHGSIVNTPPVPSIVEKSTYGDSFIINVALSKYLDLIPIDRQVKIAERMGLPGLAVQSLIGLTHHLSNFLENIYSNIKEEVRSSLFLHIDETPHKMLEGDDRKNWYLWGFFCTTACYFEIHNTRSGDVPKEFLLESSVEYLMTDGYSAYNRAVREIKEKHERVIILADCNAHAVRHFKDAAVTWKEELEPILKLYRKIYKLEEERKKEVLENNISNDEQLEIRKKMIPLFEEIKEKCEQAVPMPKSYWEQSINYFLNRYNNLILCTTNPKIELDNNLAEREFRPPVVGRKTWIGTHSKRGAMTNAVLFSIVQSCKINNINPRNYFPWVVERILKNLEPLTPFEYSKLAELG